MQDKYDGLKAIYERIKTAKSTIGLKSYKKAEEDTVIKEANLPCVFVGSGNDIILKYNNRDYLGYPATRLALVSIELVANATDDIVVMFDKLRKAVLSNPNVSTTGIIREIKSSGIQNYNMPNIKAITLVIGLNYIDGGI